VLLCRLCEKYDIYEYIVYVKMYLPKYLNPA